MESVPLPPPPTPGSSVVHSHRLADFFERLSRHIARALATLGNDAANEIAILLEFLGTLANGLDLRDDGFGKSLFAVEATDAG
jgi:hypothetical protein